MSVADCSNQLKVYQLTEGTPVRSIVRSHRTKRRKLFDQIDLVNRHAAG